MKDLNVQERFASILCHLRSKKELSQDELSRIIGVTPSAICYYEQGTRQPELDTLIKLAAYFECSVDRLLGVVDDSGKQVLFRYNLSLEDKRLLDAYHRLNAFQKQQLITYSNYLASQNTTEKEEKQLP